MPVYAAVTLLSAFLLFLVQPLIAKAILPWFGGAPSVWTTCLLFFQSLLLAGYAYAHLTRRLATRRQVVLHLILLLLTLAALPIIPSSGWKPSGDEAPAWRILGLLTAAVGAPYLLLATTAPLLQDWFRREGTNTPYRLYAWSNAGSLVALLSYPFVFERWLSIPQQAALWSGAYLAFVAGCAVIGVRVVRQAPPTGEDPIAIELSTGDTPRQGDRALWFALSACGSGLLMAITNQLTLDVAAVPFLWVVPLALYLITFIVSFAGQYNRYFWRILYLAGVGIMAVLQRFGASASLPSQIAGATLALFAGCMLCHGELVRLSPRPRYLTSFYLTMAGGGAAGGILVGLVAPAVFSDFWELPILLLLPYVLMTIVIVRESRERQPLNWVAVVGVIAVGAAGFVVPTLEHSSNTVASMRNFYGVLRVVDDRPDATYPMRHLWHGRIAHGTQSLKPADRHRTTAYYADGSGVDYAIRQHPNRWAGRSLTVGAIGLGVGTIAAYGQAGDTMRFYEINPDVERVAREHFTFLADSKAHVDVVLGDGRLSLEREISSDRGQKRFDVLVADAFSGDAVPVHLLTEEAMRLYWQALKDDGILAVHVSNRYLNLARVVTGLAPSVRKQVVRVRRDGGGAAFGSTWLLVTSNREFLRFLANNIKYGADIPAEPAVLWTDAFSNLYEVLDDAAP